MKHERRARCLTGTGVTLVAVTLGTIAACGSQDHGSSEILSASSAGAADEGETSASAGAGWSRMDANADADGGATVGGAGSTAAGPEPDSCRPSSEADLPDDDFTDTNCDGIDGDREHAIFVAPDGVDTDEGSIERPVQSLSQALVLAQTSGLDVYVCNGTYRENVVIAAPVSVYGGFDCTRGWKRTKDVAVLQAGAGLPLFVKQVQGKVHLDRLAFRGAAPVAAGQSSQAAAIVGSNDVTLSHVELKSENGVTGRAGKAGAGGHKAQPASATGGAATTSTCYTSDAAAAPSSYCARSAEGGYAESATQLCQAGFQMRGGAGGGGGNVWLAKGKPDCFKRTSTVGDDGSLGEFQIGSGAWTQVGAGQSGMSGADGADGTRAAFGIGSITDGLYVASNSGTDGQGGEPGWPGKGGAGGYSASGSGDVCRSDYRVGSGGGQGGLGGCGGGAASGGAGGGGSVALVIVDSHVALVSARFSVGNGGNGGDGAQGGAPQLGAPGAQGGSALSSTYRGQAGQPGGNGGAGGDGGPGGGGPSIAILYTGAKPDVSDAIYELGTPGDGGQAFSGSNGPSGATGEALSLQELLGEQP